MSATNTDNNKRIAKNTVYLYLRMLLTTILSLYTSRLILNNLGVEDFGIYNVVGGVVTFMGFLTASLSSATQRYLSYNLGSGDKKRYSQTFSLLVTIYLVFCIIALIILEIGGPAYINNYMTIPEDRIYAAQWVFQLALLSFLLNTFSIPYRSSIVAYEKMGIYAYLGIIEVALNLVVALTMIYLSYDQLVVYGTLMLVVQIIIVLFIILYCKAKLEGCVYRRYWNKAYFKEMVAYSGWNLFGSVTGVTILQGQAIVLNYFFGPIVNAAKAISDKVNGMVTQFSLNFYMAVTPQIIKSYAAGNIDYMRSLVLNSSRYSFMMLFIITVPLYVAMNPILCLWLGSENVSNEMVLFCQYTMIYSLVNILEQPITMAVRATGDIKKYQIKVGIITLSFLPTCILLFLMGAPAYTSMLLLSVIFIIALVVRVRIVSPIIKINTVIYVERVIKPILIVVAITIIATVILNNAFSDYNYLWIVKASFSLLIVSLSCLLFGINREERKMLNSFLIDKIRNIR